MDYHFKPIGKTCSATGTPLQPGAVCHSVLVEKNGEMFRHDYSDDGWTGPPEDAVGYWECTVPEPTSTKGKPLDTNALMRYFEQLCEEASPAQDKFRYVLALLLLQKRRLKVEGSRREDSVEYLEVRGSQGEGPFEVRDQKLTDDEVMQLQNDLNAHLESEWA